MCNMVMHFINILWEFIMNQAGIIAETESVMKRQRLILTGETEKGLVEMTCFQSYRTATRKWCSQDLVSGGQSTVHSPNTAFYHHSPACDEGKRRCDEAKGSQRHVHVGTSGDPSEYMPTFYSQDIASHCTTMVVETCWDWLSLLRGDRTIEIFCI